MSTEQKLSEELKDVSTEEGKLCLNDPKVKAKLESLVMEGMDRMPAKAWVAALALLLVAKQDDEEGGDGIELSVNGIRIGIELLPPDDDDVSVHIRGEGELS